MADDGSFWGGLMQGLQGAASDSATNPLFNMGLGLMSAAKPYGNVGDSLMQANQQTLQNRQSQQNLGMNRLNMQMLQAKLPVLQAYMQRAQGLMNPGQQSANAVPGSAPGPLSGAPSGMSINPQDALDTGTLGAMVGAPGAAELSKYPENYTKVQEALQTNRKMQLQGPMALLDSVRTSPNAHVLLQNMPDLASQYSQDAQKLGLPSDPTQATPDQARTWATLAYNRMAGTAGVAPKDMPNPVRQVSRGNGDVRDIDPITNKDVGGSPAVATSKFVQNGQVVELPTAQGVAQKLQPYDSSLYASSLITPQANEKAWQTVKATGEMPAQAGRDQIAFANESNYIAKRAAQEGVTSVSLAAKKQQLSAQQDVVKDFTNPGGTAGAKLGAVNTAVLHVNALLPLIDAMKSGNLTKLTAAKQAYQKETGVPAPTNYDTLANMAIGEINNVVNAKTGGDAAERDRIAAPFVSSRAPDVLKGAVKTAVGAMAGKTESLANQWDVATEGNQGNFGKFLLPQTATALGWMPHKDANGNKALVSPDGKYFKQL